METVLVSTFYSFQPLVAAVHAYSPARIILIIDKSASDKSEVKAGLEQAKEVFGKVAPITVRQVDGSDLYDTASTIVDLLDTKGKDERIIVNISGGWKLAAQGVLYGCYARHEMVAQLVCNDLKEDEKVVELPKLCYGIGKKKLELLSLIEKRKGKPISELADNLEKTRGMLYQHLKELKALGYVDENFEITLAGRLALL